MATSEPESCNLRASLLHHHHVNRLLLRLLFLALPPLCSTFFHLKLPQNLPDYSRQNFHRNVPLSLANPLDSSSANCSTKRIQLMSLPVSLPTRSVALALWRSRCCPKGSFESHLGRREHWRPGESTLRLDRDKRRSNQIVAGLQVTSSCH